MQSLMLSRVQAGSEAFLFSIDNPTLETIGEFIEQMDTAYIHPRRDSYHVSLCSEGYSNFCAPSSWNGTIANVRKKEFLPSRASKKNLSQTA